MAQRLGAKIAWIRDLSGARQLKNAVVIDIFAREDVEFILSLDRKARIERDQRRRGGYGGAEPAADAPPSCSPVSHDSAMRKLRSILSFGSFMDA